LDQEDPILLVGLHFGNARRNWIDDEKLYLFALVMIVLNLAAFGIGIRGCFHQASRWQYAGSAQLRLKQE